MSIYKSPTDLNLTADPSELFVWLNDVTNLWFGNSLLLVIWLLLLAGYLLANKDDYAGAMAVSSYVTAILCLLGWLFGLFNGYAFSIIIGVSMVSTILLLAQKRGQ